MARTTAEPNARVDFRLPAAEKDKITRAAGIAGLDLTTYVRQQVLQAANATIERSERLELSERDARRLLEYLDSNSEPTEHLRRAARTLPKDALR